MQRLWWRLGFGARVQPSLGPPKEGFSDSYVHAGIYFDVTWRDRLRILVSGKLYIGIAVRMDVAPTKVETISNLSVLPPGHKKPPPAQ